MKNASARIKEIEIELSRKIPASDQIIDLPDASRMTNPELEQREREQRASLAVVREKAAGVGSKSFIEEMKDAFGFRATGRKILCADDTFELRETITPYGKDSDLDSGNTFLWK